MTHVQNILLVLLESCSKYFTILSITVCGVYNLSGIVRFFVTVTGRHPSLLQCLLLLALSHSAVIGSPWEMAMWKWDFFWSLSLNDPLSHLPPSLFLSLSLLLSLQAVSFRSLKSSFTLRLFLALFGRNSFPYTFSLSLSDCLLDPCNILKILAMTLQLYRNKPHSK